MKPGRFLPMLLLLLASGPLGAATPPAPASQVLVLLRLPPPHVRVGTDYAGSYGDQAGRAARFRIAAKLARRNGLTLVDDWPMPLLEVDCYVMAIPDGRSPKAVAAALTEARGVAWSQPVNEFVTQRGASRPVPIRGPDPLFEAQPAAFAWHLADLHRIADGRGVKVAIIDSQVDRSHPDLAGQVGVSANFVVGRREMPEQHGTAVAGIIAAVAGNGVGIAGVAPRATLMALRACWQKGPASDSATVCDSFSLAKAVYFAVENRADVVNLSLGGPPDPLLAQLLDLARARRATVVAAYDRNAANGGFPASLPGVVAVASDAPGRLRDGVFTAPGRGIPATSPGARWQIVDGSSFAAAQVSGLVALMRSRRGPAAQPPTLVGVSEGAGAIDSCASVLRAAPGCNCTCPTQIASALRN